MGKRSRKGPLGLNLPPPPGEILEVAEEIVEDLQALKTIPQALLGGLREADEDFKEADKSFRGTRLQVGKRKKARE